MKLAFLLSILLFFEIAHADQCVQQICVGNSVIDSSNRIGQVVAVGPEAVTYSIPGYGNSITVAPFELSPEVANLGAFSKGITVIDPNEYTGSVSRVFADGRVQYLISGYSTASIATVKTLSQEVSELGALKINILVIDNNDYTGTVIQLFANGKVKYRIDGYSSSSIGSTRSLSPQVESLGDLRADVKVIDNNEYIGTVVQLFANGKVKYRINGYSSSSIGSTRSLSPQVESLEDLSAGVQVIDHNDYVGTVNLVFANKKVNYTIEGYSSSSIGTSSSLSPAVKKIGSLESGATIIDSNQYIGKVERLFANNKVQYIKNGYSSSSIGLATSLSPKVDSLDDLVANILVVDSENNVGQVKMLFANGQVQYLKSGYSSSSFGNSKSLSPEVSGNPNYSKDTLYASENYQIGKPAHFFKNGLIQLVDNSGNSIELSRSLSAQVQQLNGYSEGVEIINAANISGTVKMVFANGTVQYSFSLPANKDNPKPRQQATSAKILGAVPEKLKEDQEYWISAFANTLDDKYYWHRPMGLNLVDIAADFPNLKKQLVTLLQQEPNLVASRLYEKVIEFLDPSLAIADSAHLSSLINSANLVLGRDFVDSNSRSETALQDGKIVYNPADDRSYCSISKGLAEGQAENLYSIVAIETTYSSKGLWPWSHDEASVKMTAVDKDKHQMNINCLITPVDTKTEVRLGDLRAIFGDNILIALKK